MEQSLVSQIKGDRSLEYKARTARDVGVVIDSKNIPH